MRFFQKRGGCSFPLTVSPNAFDLNVEYKPSVVEKDRTLTVETSLEVEEYDGDKENIDPLDGEEDGVMCDVCQSTDGDPSNPIVFCDGCDLMVHASCYGNPLVKAIPEGDWFCWQCIASRSLKKKRESLSLAACVQPKVGR